MSLSYSEIPKNLILTGDWIDHLKKLRDKSVHMGASSPPYYLQRLYPLNPAYPYNQDGQLGREKTPEEYIEKLVLGFREVRRVLRDDGTFWLNLGDRHHDHQLLMLPHRVALALQADGWYVREDVVWDKTNAVGFGDNRPTTSHEFIFLLSKCPHYYYDGEAIGEPYSPETLKEINAIYKGRARKDYAAAGAQNASDVKRRIIKSLSRGWANKKSVWHINTAAYSGKHTATFPEEIPRICIKAGTSERGCCPKCGAPWARVTEKEKYATRPGTATKVANMLAGEKGFRDPKRTCTLTRTVGWKPTCQCGGSTPLPPVSCTVLDPFGGSGTTAAVAAQLGRYYVIIEINPECVEEEIKKRVKSMQKSIIGYLGGLACR